MDPRQSIIIILRRAEDLQPDDVIRTKDFGWSKVVGVELSATSAIVDVGLVQSERFYRLTLVDTQQVVRDTTFRTNLAYGGR